MTDTEAWAIRKFAKGLSTASPESAQCKNVIIRLLNDREARIASVGEMIVAEANVLDLGGE